MLRTNRMLYHSSARSHAQELRRANREPETRPGTDRRLLRQNQFTSHQSRACFTHSTVISGTRSDPWMRVAAAVAIMRSPAAC